MSLPRYRTTATHENVSNRTIYNGPTGLSGCGCEGGIPSPNSWYGYGWAVSDDGTGAIAESWHVEHARERPWTGTPITGTSLGGTQTESSQDDWYYSLTFEEAKPLGTSSNAWDYTEVEGGGGGAFHAENTIEASGSYQYGVRQGLGTVTGTKDYTESLVEDNSYQIDFEINPAGDIAFLMDGVGTQQYDRAFAYAGQTGSVSYSGGNGTFSLEESGCVNAEQLRTVNWQYADGSYDAESEIAKCTQGHHQHEYQDSYGYTSGDSSYGSSASWTEDSTWSNQLTKHRTLADSPWSTLWTDRFSSYEQSGCAEGGGERATASWGSGCGCSWGYSDSDAFDYTGCWSESYDSLSSPAQYAFEGSIDNHVTGWHTGCGSASPYDESNHEIGFRSPSLTYWGTFSYVNPAQTGRLGGSLDGSNCGCGCGCGGGSLYGFETAVPLGLSADSYSTATLGRMTAGSLRSPAATPALADQNSQLGAFRAVYESPSAVRAASLENYREPNAIHGNGSPSLPQNAVFADWGQWRNRYRLNLALEDAIDDLAGMSVPPASGSRPAIQEAPGVVVLDLYDADQSGDNSVALNVANYLQDGETQYKLREPEGEDALVNASLEGSIITISVPEASTAAGLTAVNVVSTNADGLPVSWTVLVHVVSVDGYTVEEQAWGEATWDVPEDSGDDWSLLWQCNDYRWKPQTTFDGLTTAADWSFGSAQVDPSRDRWTYANPSSTGEFEVTPTVTFGGETPYFETLNTASVGLHREEAPSAAQPRIAATYVSYMDWEDVAWSREIEVEEYGDYAGVAKLTTTDDGRVVYPNYTHHPVIPQPIDHNTVRVKVELGAAVPEGMTGTLHLAWYDPNNTLANLGTPETSGHGLRDNAASLSAAGGNLPGFTLEFTTDGPTETSDSVQKAYLAIDDARYGDNFIVVAHPNEGIAETFEFRANGSQPLVLMRPANTGLWHALPDESGNDYRTTVLTILPSVDIDTDSDNNGPLERSDWEEEIENEQYYIGAYVSYNSNDSNKNQILDYQEDPSVPGWVAFSDPDLVQVILDRGFEDLSGMNDFLFELKVTTGANRGLSYWLDREKTCIETSAYAPDDIDYITENGNDKTVYYWFVSGGNIYCPPEIFVEGVNPDALTDTLIWRLWKPVDSLYVEGDVDTVKLTDPAIDIDIDSDNRNGVERSKQEERYEWVGEFTPYGLGKVIAPPLYTQGVLTDERRVPIEISVRQQDRAALRFHLLNPSGAAGGNISLWSARSGGAQFNFDQHLRLSEFPPANWQPDPEHPNVQILTLWIQGQTENYVRYTQADEDIQVNGGNVTRSDVLHRNIKPTTALRAIWEMSDGEQYHPVANDTVSYIVADPSTFWWELAYSPDFSAGLASKLVYNADGSKPDYASPDNFCLEPITQSRRLQELGFENFRLKKGVFGCALPGAFDFQCNVLDALSGRASEAQLGGLQVRLYFDHIAQRYVVAFKGSDPAAISHQAWQDWVRNNLQEAVLWPPFAPAMSP